MSQPSLERPLASGRGWVAAQAQVHGEKPTYAFEKCCGVAKAGANDCFTAANACGSTSTVDNQREFWVYVPIGTCKKLVGGQLQASKKV